MNHRSIWWVVHITHPGMCNNIETEPNIEIEIAISRRYWDRGHIEIEKMKNELLRLKLILQKAFQKYWFWDWYCTKEKLELSQYFLHPYVVNIVMIFRLKHQYCKKFRIESILKQKNAYGRYWYWYWYCRNALWCIEIEIDTVNGSIGGTLDESVGQSGNKFH